MSRIQSRISSSIVALCLCTVTATSTFGKSPKSEPERSVSKVPVSKTLRLSAQIDKLVEKALKENGEKPNAMASDEVFLRRVYLDIVGRIPTIDEAKSFLNSAAKDKRSKLIDKLLDSEGHVSHQYNYFADLLRLQSRMRYAPAQPYLDFVKDSIRENKPYDQFVRDLVTAEGYTWDNGAAGYYLRDTGMPLDNMSNTVQVFLGTQLVCAQCHDHPFDSWTQKQYYQLAAFTYGIQTRDRRNGMYMEMRKKRKSMEQEVYRAANRILRPLAYRVNQTERPLRLPDDYQYSDGKPKEKVDPATIFGESVEVHDGDSPKEIYARWMTSPKNPRFAAVIANRFWKRAMGVGVVEPVDDMKDGIEPSNPELMQYLTKVMVDGKFDLKQYQRVVFNTKSYQREVSKAEQSDDEYYYFPGPVLRRLTAEQLWDSLLAATLPQLDIRKGVPTNNYRYTNGEELVDKEFDEIVELAKLEAKRRKANFEYQRQTADMRKQMRIASRTGNREESKRLNKEMAKIRKKIYGEKLDKEYQKTRQRSRRNRIDKDPRWAGFSRDLVRASEVSSPARPGHFLRQFGQSDRETIENANDEASVPQILTLLNGPIYYQMFNRNSVLAKNMADADSAEEKLDVIYLSLLSRKPTKREVKLTLPLIKEKGTRGVSDVVWAILNTRQFMFVQ